VRRWSCIFTAVLTCLLSGCAMGPDYERPEMYDVAAFRGSDGDGMTIAWKLGEPSDELPKGEWWRLFKDETLNRLQGRARENNQSLKAALARIDSARATARQAKSEFVPRVTAEPSFDRTRDSENTNFGVFGSNPANEINVPLDLSYEVDLWGRVRRQVESNVREAEATVADYENLLLSLQAELAQNYFSYKALLAEEAILTRTLEIRAERLKFIEKRVEFGEASDLDRLRAESDFKVTESELLGVRSQRDQLRNAIATLVGEPASGFEMPAVDQALTEPPVIPVGLPSSLLERRPDVAAAERRLAARNAEIGIAKASFFPQLRLTGQFGFASDDFSNLFSLSSRVWSIGPSLFIPVFQSGRLFEALDSTKAEYEVAVAEYRQRLLVAFQEVEDSLVGLEYLTRQHEVNQSASEAAHKAERLSQIRYDSGVVDYLELLDAQRTALGLERTVVRTQGQKLVIAVALIEALGGGW
jgi:multidrug efflux system outer membrane protein